MKEKKVYKSLGGKEKIISYYESLLKLWPVPSEHLNVKTRFGNTFIIASGDKDKEPIIMLHGSATNSAMWMGDVVKLSKDYRVYAVDIIGEPGKSDESRPEMTAENYSNWISDILDELKISKVNLIGNSLGGWLSLCFATENPERVNKLVLIATSGVAREKRSFLFKVIFLSMLGKKGIDKINQVVSGNLEMPKKVIEFSSLVFNNFNPRIGKLYLFSDEELSKLTMPVLLMAGEKDALLQSEKTAERLKMRLTNVQVKMIKDCGHVVINVTDDIIKFLKEIY